MIGLILEHDAAKRIYITPASVQINSPQQDCNYWLARNPRNNETANVKSWGGLIDDVFKLTGIQSVKEAVEKVYELNTTIPYGFISTETTIPAFLNDLISDDLKQSKSVTRFLASGLLDTIYINASTNGLCGNDYSLSKLNPNNIFLPENTELTPTTSKGAKSGFYLVSVELKSHQPFKIPANKMLVTDTQLTKIRPMASNIEIHKSYAFNSKMVRLREHRVYQRFNDILVFAKKNSKEEVAQRLIVGSLINAKTNEGHLSSIGMYLRSQSWVRAYNNAQELLELGINATKLNHNSVTYERE